MTIAKSQKIPPIWPAPSPQLAWEEATNITSVGTSVIQEFILKAVGLGLMAVGFIAAWGLAVILMVMSCGAPKWD